MTGELEAAFSLPPIGPAGLPGGLSHDGQRLVVERAWNGVNSRFVVLDASNLMPLADVILPGLFTFDVLSPDGSVLYLLEYLEGDLNGRYQVRAYDIEAGGLRDEVVVDKATLESAMAGRPVAQVTGAGGHMSYTLYHDEHHGAFIHALDTGDGTAICINLPRGAPDGATSDRHWALGLSADGRMLFAANGRLGQVAVIDTREEKVVASAAFRQDGSTTSRDDSGGEHVAPQAPTMGGLALSPDGTTLYLAGSDGIARIETVSLELLGRILPGTPVSSIAASPSGERVYGVTPTGIAIVDVSSGRATGELTGIDQPYGILALLPDQ